MVLAIFIAALLYIAVCTVTATGLMPWQDLLASRENWPTGFVVRQTLGLVGLVILGIAMFCAVVSGMNAFYISTSRLMYAMADEGSLPAVFKFLSQAWYSAQRHSLHYGDESVCSVVWSRSAQLIVDMTSVGAAIVFAYTTGSAAIMARKAGDTKQVWIGILGCLFSLFFLSLLLIPGMPGYLAFQSRVILLVWIAIGFIFYLIIRKNYGEIQRKRKLIRRHRQDTGA